MIRGRARGTDGRPRTGVRVYFSSAPGPEPEMAASTDADGRFILTARHLGPYEIAATDDSGRTVTQKVVMESHNVENLEFEMPD